MYSSTDSFADVADQYDAAASWLHSLGVAVPHGGRHGEYQRLLRGLEHAHSAGEIRTFLNREGLDAVLNASLEGAELRRIHRSLAKVGAEGLIDRLRKFVKGPASSLTENPKSSSNLARNIALELSIGSRLRDADLAVDFGGEVRKHLDKKVQTSDVAIIFR